MAKPKVKWGVLGAASIATKKVIPGMQKGEWSEIAAIASRDLKKAKDAARKLGIAKAYGSYEELLADPEIEAVYNPLPNHLHVPWSVKAAEEGKHVLCEKPLSLSVAEARTLLEARDRCSVKIGEAFMVRSHPQFSTFVFALIWLTLGVIVSWQALRRWRRIHPLACAAVVGLFSGLGGSGLYMLLVAALLGGSPASMSSRSAPSDVTSPRIANDANRLKQGRNANRSAAKKRRRRKNGLTAENAETAKIGNRGIG